MRTYLTLLHELRSTLCVGACLLLAATSQTAAVDPPILARASFLIPPGRRPDFEVDYREKILPHLVAKGLKPSSETPRPSVDSVFVNLLEARTTAEIADIRHALAQDDRWFQLLADLNVSYPTLETSRKMWFLLDAYRAPLGPGKPVSIGPGRVTRLPRESDAWQRYLPRDGLAGAKVFDITQDSAGNVWFATLGGGVSKFDGQMWTTYTTRSGLPSNEVRGVIADRKGRIWFATSGGVAVHDPNGGPNSWVTYTVENGLADNWVGRGIEGRNGVLWFTTRGGVLQFDPADGGEWTTLKEEDGLADNRVFAIHQDRAGRMWFGTRNGLSRYDPRASTSAAWTTFRTKDGLPSNRIMSISEDAGGRLWVGAPSKLAVTGPQGPETSSWRILGPEQGLFDTGVTKVFHDSGGGTWVLNTGLVGGGLRHGITMGRDPEAVVWQNHLEKDRIHAMTAFEDREGNLWIGTDGQGVLRYEGRSWLTIGRDEGLPHPGSRVIYSDDDGSLWIGTLGGLGHVSDDTIRSWTEDDGLPESNIFTIRRDRQGNLWMGSLNQGGLLRFTGRSSTQFGENDGLAGGSITFVGEDALGNVWVGTYPGLGLGSQSGIALIAGKTVTTVSRADGLVGSPRSFHSSEGGRAWIGTRGGGIALYDPESVSPWPLTHYGEEDGLPARNVEAIARTRAGVLWLATTDGLVRLGPAASEQDHPRFTTYTREDGLGENQIRAIFEDRGGRIWIGTFGGGVSVHDPSTKKGEAVFQTFTTEDGLANDAIYSIVQDHVGNLWFATTGAGVSRYLPPELVPPPVVIDAVVADRRYSSPVSLSLPSTTGLISIGFHGISLRSRPDGLIYRYRLAGYEADWQTTRTRRVEYEDIPRGEYRFEVEAIDGNLVSSEQPAVVALTVHLPYGQMGWGVAAIVFLIAAGWQTARVVRRDRRLRQSNEALSTANNELFEVNLALQRDRAVERIRAEVQSMDQAEDFERVLSLLTTDLKETGLTFESCEIDVLGEPVDQPTMALFEETGFRYTTYTLDPEGHVAAESFDVSAPFPAVIRRTLERFIAGEPWQAQIEGQSIVEVPASGYGRLRLTASERDSFTDDEVATLREFAGAVALGYTRYLDIREIQEQTERKSAFLASMSHELRTPMNAIKGFANLILRRETGGMSERAQENLGKIDQASNHLLAMLNDLLDLSKIEAGRMDVNPERFDVRELVTGACDTVSPLIQEGVELRQDVADDIGEANTDKARVQQMVINLLSNAIKFTDSGSVTVNASHSDGQLVIAVSDTGKGIPADELPTIFDEYRQAEGSESAVQKGTGLGLSITKKFAELLGGSIGVESEVGKGSTFTVRVPVEYQEPRSSLDNA